VVINEDGRKIAEALREYFLRAKKYGIQEIIFQNPLQRNGTCTEEVEKNTS